jgi:exopolyphosphatase/guanosine-5'-triphosphate,3'-diphosphate pyrophosphatase
MKIATIDVGTNSIHTLIVDGREDGTFHVVDRCREMVRLGEEQSDAYGLTSRAIEEGLRAMLRARQLCDSQGVEAICAVATSAVREAPNGAEFLNLVEAQTGITVKAITGQEEARLIHLAVRESLDLEGRRALIIDIGGGSVEFIVGTQRDLYFADSVKCGVLRLRDRFPLSDPPDARELRKMREFIEKKLQRVISQVRDAGFERVIGSSGTISALLELALGSKNGLQRIHNQVFPRRRVQSAVRRLGKMTLDQRRSINSLTPGRADTILPGGILFLTALEQLGIEKVIGCEWALREGILINHLMQNRDDLEVRAQVPEPRRRSVFSLIQRCNWAETHSQQVGALALLLFDQLKPLHRLDSTARELLEYAALLHDIGYHISAKGHHKHGHYLVLHGGLLGFEPAEVQILAAIVRYHRGRIPGRNDVELESLSGRARRIVEVLAGLLRVADGLDRTHFSLVQRVECSIRDTGIEIKLIAHGDAELEVWYARHKSDLLARTLGRPLTFRNVARLDSSSPSQEDN